jgi:molybdenum cofactor cytidylyltransferase
VDRGVAVVRPEDDELAARLVAEGFEALPFPGAARGMGASLAFGVANAADAGGCLVALADMPFVKPATVAALADALRAGSTVVVPVFRGRRGHPVGFARSLFPELVLLDGEAGARSTVAEHAAQVTLVECDDDGTVRDVDAPEDLPIQGDPDIDNKFS